MEIIDVIKQYSNGKGEGVMWASIDILNEVLNEHLSQDERMDVVRRVYYAMVGGHYDRHFAEMQISEMFYVDPNGERHQAPYWGEEDLVGVYRSIRGEIPSEYNLFDFEVAINMIKSDYCNILKHWFPSDSKEELMGRIVELTVNFFNDDDCQSSQKIWDYFNK